MVDTIKFKHHETKKEITGYGVADFVKNYNCHTMNESKDREHFLPEGLSSAANIKDAIEGFKPKKKEAPSENSKAPNSENLITRTVKKVTKKKATKKKVAKKK